MLWGKSGLTRYTPGTALPPANFPMASGGSLTNLIHKMTEELCSPATLFLNGNLLISPMVTLAVHFIATSPLANVSMAVHHGCTHEMSVSSTELLVSICPATKTPFSLKAGQAFHTKSPIGFSALSI